MDKGTRVTNVGLRLAEPDPEVPKSGLRWRRALRRGTRAVRRFRWRAK